MDVRFPLPDGFVDLDARLVVRAGSVRRLSVLECRLLAILHAHERRTVSHDALVHELWGSGSDDGLGTVEVVLQALRRKLEAPGGPRVLRAQAGLGVGVWPAHRAVEVVGDVAVVVLVEAVEARSRPEAPSSWAESNAALRGSSAEHDVELLAVPGALIAACGAVEDVLRFSESALGRGGVVAGATRARWLDGGRDGALDAAVERACALASAAPEGLLVADARLARAVERPGTLERCGRLALALDAAPEPVWCTPGVRAPLLPRRPEARLWSADAVFGRDDTVQAVLAALNGGAGIVVLHGPRGSGTTTVAIRVAAGCQRRRRGRGGVHVAHLAGPHDDASLASAVAASLGLRHAASDGPGVGRALAALGDFMLVIDGFDGITDDDAATLWRWREDAPRCSFIVTARRPARLPGGVLVAVAPLEGPDALAMLRDRTRGLPGWDETVEDAVLDSIVEHTGGSPLALVLTAGLARTQRPERLVTRLAKHAEEGRAPTLHEAVKVSLARLPGAVGPALERLTLLRSPFSVGEVAALVEELELDGAEVVSVLLDAGLVARRDDPELGEPRFVLPSAVYEVARRAVQPPLALELRRVHTLWIGARAGTILRALFRAGQDRWALRQLALSQRELTRAASELVDLEPALAAQAVRALFVRWRLGAASTEVLSDCAAAVLDEGETAPTMALMRAQLALATDRVPEALSLLKPALAGPPAVADMARVLALGSSRGPGAADRRRRLAAIVHRALEEVGPDRLGWVWDLVQVLLQRGMYGDASELASRYVVVAAEVGSELLRAGLIRLAWRGRAALGRARAEEWTEVAEALRTLARLGAHAGATEGIQDLARHMAAIGQPALALATLDRAQIYLDVYASAAVRRSLLLDRARALWQLGRRDQARALIARYTEIHAAAGEGVHAGMDRTLLALTELDFDGAREALDGVEADARTSDTARRWCLYLRAAVDLGDGDAAAARERLAGARPLWPGELVMSRLVEAWSSSGTPPLPELDRAAAHLEARSVGMSGVVLRATLVAARRLAEGSSGQ